jgi:hypothetical protein
MRRKNENNVIDRKEEEYQINSENGSELFGKRMRKNA